MQVNYPGLPGGCWPPGIGTVSDCSKGVDPSLSERCLPGHGLSRNDGEKLRALYLGEVLFGWLDRNIELFIPMLEHAVLSIRL